MSSSWNSPPLIRSLAFLASFLLGAQALAQTSPNWALHYVPPPGEWNALFGSKADVANPAFTGAIMLNGVAVDAGPVSSAQVLTAHGTTALPLSALLSTAWDVRSQGVKCDGVTNDTAAMQAALTASASAGAALAIYDQGTACLLSSALTVPSNATLIGIGNPTLKANAATAAGIFNIRGVTNVRISGVTLDGNSGIMTDASSIIGAFGMTSSYLSDLVIKNPRSGIVLGDGFGFGGSHNNRLANIDMTNAQTSALSLSNSNANDITDFTTNGHTGFGVWVTGTSAYNRVTRARTHNSGIELIGVTSAASHNDFVDPSAYLEPYTAWSAGITVTSGQSVTSAFNVYTAGAAGTTGASPPTCTSGTCSDGTITWTYVRPYSSTGDNCFSLSGSYNSITGGRGEGCWRDGVAFFGDHNVATGIIFRNVSQSINHGLTSHYFCIDFDSNYGGIAQYNTAVGNSCEDDQTTHTVFSNAAFQFGYSLWNTGAVYVAAYYVYNAGNIYQTAAGGTAGATAPTCTSGTCSDGGVTWTWLRSFKIGSVTPPNPQASNNVLVGNMFGQTSSGIDITDGTQSQYNLVQQSSQFHNANFLFNSSGIAFSGSNLQGTKLGQTWTAGVDVSYGQSYISTANGRIYRVINAGGTLTVGNAPTVTSGTQTTGDGVQWVMEVAFNTFAQFVVGNHFFDLPGCIQRDSVASITTFVLDCVGSGSPLSVVAAPLGSTYHRTDGGVGTSLYVKETQVTAGDSTGWAGK